MWSNPLAEVPIYDRLAFYLNIKSLNNLNATSKKINKIGMQPNYRAKLYYYDATEACKRGDIEVVKWLSKKMSLSEQFTCYEMDIACCYGHLEVVEWLHKNRTEGCTTEAMDSAAANGQLEVIKWLHKNRSEGCTWKAMNFAATWGYLETVKWLYENMDVNWCIGWAISNAKYYDHIEIVKYLEDKMEK